MEYEAMDCIDSFFGITGGKCAMVGVRVVLSVVYNMSNGKCFVFVFVLVVFE